MDNKARRGLIGAGFHWAEKQSSPGPAFIEVYPHVAIIELFSYPCRFPYKVQKRGRYWPRLSADERLRKIGENFFELRSKLANDICNIDEFLPPLDPAVKYPLKFLKNHEDIIAALICGLVGHFFLKGEALPFGDDRGVIWVPSRRGPNE